MSVVFADTFYWIARINPRDQWHQKATELSASLKNTYIITSEEVLIELLNYFSKYGPEMRQAVAAIVRHIIDDTNMMVTSGDFKEGLSLFEARLDKGYSLTDCLSMCIMRRHKVAEVLSHDHHFVQEGFITLL
ncbi:MAG TPA: PIN domain-containing protein [Pyrinomonadaceae bacterium]